jgi:phosphatidylglycerol:prolipoprotein diacylglycerol transferase
MVPGVTSYTLSVLSVGIDPTIELGPVTLAWHGITIAIGILVGSMFAARLARERGYPSDPLYGIGVVIALAGLIGGKVFWLIETGRIAEPSEWLSTRGFTFNGGLILASIAIAIYLRRTGIGLPYLDVVALAFPIGVAVGRIGDVINGEHYGPESTWLLAVRNTHPHASVPSPDVAYHSGGLYEVLIALAIFAIVWPRRRRFTRPLTAVWTVLALFAVGRFFEFFYRDDSENIALGLNSAQWTSVALLVVALAGLAYSLRRWPARHAPTLRPSSRATTATKSARRSGS